MGVRGLWRVLKPAAETTTFMEFVAEGFKTVKPRKGLVVGIDASLWFFQVQNPFLSGHWNAGHSPELRTVFHRLAFLSTLPLTPLFVFDGPQRPAIKRGTRTLGPEHWMAPVFRNFISAFGFDSHVAPGEAEAELAMLNRVGIIDAVFTEDVDTLIFGAHTVVRGTSNKRDHMEISIYRSARILEHPDVRLSTGGLVMMALLCGGDYDQQGLVGCGPSVAHPLSTSDLADNLHQAALAPDVTAHQLVDALIDWREDLQHQLRDNPQHLLPRRYPALSQLIPFSFPLPSILRLYIAPLTSSSPLPPGSPLLSLGQQHLDITTLAALCETHFCWGLTEGVANALRSSVWPAAVSRTMQDSITGVRNLANPLALHSKISLLALDPLKVRRQRSVKANSYVRELQIDIDDKIFAEAANARRLTILRRGYQELADSDADDTKHHPSAAKKITRHVWLPAFLVDAFDPRAVAAFLDLQKASKHLKRQRSTPVTRPKKKARIAQNNDLVCNADRSPKQKKVSREVIDLTSE